VGETLLHPAVESKSIAIMKLFLGLGAAVNSMCFTPLHKAASSGFIEGARLLIESGADVNSRTSRGHTPLDFACHYEMKELLMEKGGKYSDISI
jgi:ankyrin repeat protein